MSLPCTVVVAPREVPERDRDWLSVDPLPVLGVGSVPDGAQPVLAVGVALVSAPQLPREEALEGWVGLIH